MPDPIPVSDPIVRLVIGRLAARSAAGMAKYGVGLCRTDLPHAQWLRHLQDELLDAANYLEVLIQAEDAGHG